MKKVSKLLSIIALIAVIGFSVASCEGFGITNSDGHVVSIAEIHGVYKPEAGGNPFYNITETEQYTGDIMWDPPVLDSYMPSSSSYNTFDLNTVYTATITLSVKSNYTLQGVRENFFKVAGATTTNAANSGVIKAVFPKTADNITEVGYLQSYLINQPDNTADTPYIIKMNLSDFTYGVSSDIHTLDYLLRDCKKYVFLDLSDSTFTDIPDGAFYNNYGGYGKTGHIVYLPQRKGNEYLTGITIGGNIKSIGKEAFFTCNNLTDVTILDSVESIGDLAFCGCKNLTDISIGNNVKSIGSGAFEVCTGLTDITIPNSVTSLGREAFHGCTELSNITLGNGLTTIEHAAFAECSSLTDIIIPDSVTSINYNKEQFSPITSAFFGCTSLKNVVIGKGVTVIEARTFYECTSIVNITIPNVKTIESFAFYGCTGIVNITLPDSVESIGESAFNRCSKLTSITIPNKVTSIEDRTFAECTSLNSVTLPNNITNIGDYAFFGCTSLTGIALPNSITGIGESAFRKCANLTVITIPNKVIGIKDFAFFDCTNLTDVTILDGVTSIGKNAFYNNVFTGITIPKSVSSIDGSAFQSCASLTEIIIDSNNNKYMSQDGVLYNKDMTTLVAYPSGKTGDFTIPDTVKTIVSFAFTNNYITKITISANVTAIMWEAFTGCKELSTVIFESSYPMFSNNQNYKAFADNLDGAFSSGGKGTYIRNSYTLIWRKQP